MSQSIRVVIADDHELVRKALAFSLAADGEIEIVAEVATADDALAAVVQHKPAVLVLDVDMPGMDAFDAAAELIKRSPDTRVLFLSAYPHDRHIKRAIEVGAAGYLCKSDSPRAVAQGIVDVARGQTCFSPDIRSRLVEHNTGPRTDQAPATKASTLSPRESQVLGLIAIGRTRRQIADELGLSIKTIEKHSTSLMNKLDIHDRVGLTRFAIREGLIEP